MANLSKKETIERLCKLVSEVGELPHGCFCRKNPDNCQIDVKII